MYVRTFDFCSSEKTSYQAVASTNRLLRETLGQRVRPSSRMNVREGTREESAARESSLDLCS